MDQKKKRRRKKKNKRKKKHKQELEDTSNILAGLNMEEMTAEKFAKEREDAERLFNAKLFQEGLECEDGVRRLFAEEKIEEEIPNFSKEDDMLFNTDHIQRIPSSSVCLKLADLLDFHFSTQMLNNVDNFYTCPKCTEEVDLDKNIRFLTIFYRIYQPPDYLCISLKRFRQVTRGFGISFAKDDRHVEFELELDISKYCLSKNLFFLIIFLGKNDAEEQFLYELIAVMVHSGSLKGGHYTAYAKHKSSTGEPQWYHYSDTKFHHVAPSAVLKAQAYMLFYKRKYL